MKTISTACATALVMLTMAGAALACTGPNVLFEDDFSESDPSWGGDLDGQRIANGKLVVSPALYSGYAIENQVGFFTDFDVCVDVVQKNNDPTTGYAGILFWGDDYDNFYTFDVATNGYVRVSRKQKGRWLTPVAWKLIEGVQADRGLNQVRVRVKGNQATLFVNDVQAATFRGQPTQGGSLIGVYGSSPKDSTGIYEFDNYRVTDLGEDAPPQNQPPPGIKIPGAPEPPKMP